MKIKTELLQKMLGKSIKGASNNNLIPITSLMGIEYADDNLILTTTDGNNQFRVRATESQLGITEKQSNFYTIVNADTFSKLVAKTTKEFIELNNNENYLEVVGNGTYKLEIALNEDDEMVKFPEANHISEVANSIKIADLQDSIRVAKASVAKTLEIPFLTGYYIGKNVITTNKEMVCKLETTLVDVPILISFEMAELLLLVESSEAIQLERKDNHLYFYTDNYEIIGNELEGKEMYPVQPIENLVSQDYNSFIKVDKQDLLNVLDRMSLFVTDYDRNGVFLDFTEAGFIIRSQKSNAEEIIDAEGTLESGDGFSCLADIEMLKSQVETVSTDIVEIWYGQEKSLKIVDKNCSLVISLLDKNN